MRTITIVLFSELAGGMAAHDDGELRIEFHRARPNGPLPPLVGAIWVLVDWLLPELSGLEVCRRLRCNPRTAPAHITMVLEEEDVAARRRSIAAGADDTFVGPVDRAMLLERVLAHVIPRLDEDDPRGLVQLDELVVDLSAFQARWRDKPLALMPIQLRLLRFFMEHPGQIYTRVQLIAALGSQLEPLEERTVDVWIGRLRRALRAVGAGNRLRTVRSLGYVLEPPRQAQRRRRAA